jgi:long-chain acyl-CoA synthetase
MHPYIHAASTPDKIAYRMSASGETVTYAQLEERSNRFAQLLRARGLKAGDHIAMMLENHPRFFEIAWGAQRAGIIYTAISSRLTADEAGYIVNDCAAKAGGVLADAGTGRRTAAAGLSGRGNLADDRRTPAGWQSYAAEVAAQPADRIADETAGADMLYSSGTTGRPKGVFVPPELPDIDASSPLLALAGRIYQMDGDTVYLSPAPLYHAAPLRFNMRCMRLGGTCVVMEHFDAEDFLRLIQQHRITHTQLVPTMFVRMLKLPDAARNAYDSRRLKIAIHAAAPCPVPVKEQMIAWWGPVLMEYYAGTEGNGMTMVNSADWLTHKGTVGRAVVGELQDLRRRRRRGAHRRRAGTVYFANGKPFAYHNDSAKTDQSRNAQGWTTLGDVGRVDAEGFLYLTDRKAYMIISGGVNIYPQEAENVLVTHPKVVDVAVFGVPTKSSANR